MARSTDAIVRHAAHEYEHGEPCIGMLYPSYLHVILSTRLRDPGLVMATTKALVEALKQELRARRLTYAAVARHLGLSEVTVKRMFSTSDFSLERVDRICALAGIDFSELARSLSQPSPVIAQLTYEQEKEFVDHPKLMLVALCVLNRWRFEDIVGYYDLTEVECIRLLTRLDKLRFIELLPNNRIRLLISSAFAWIPGGPIQHFFKSQMQADFFRAAFDRPGEVLLLASGAVSPGSLSRLTARLKQTAAEFAEMRSEDSRIPAGERTPVTLLLAARGWEPQLLQQFRRAQTHRKAAGRVRVKGKAT